MIVVDDGSVFVLVTVEYGNVIGLADDQAAQFRVVACIPERPGVSLAEEEIL
jgi:hypothetical protein